MITKLKKKIACNQWEVASSSEGASLFFLVGGSEEGKGGLFFKLCLVWRGQGSWMLPNSMVGITKCNFSPYWWKALPYIQACLAKGHFAKQKTHPQGYHNICFGYIHSRHWISFCSCYVSQIVKTTTKIDDETLPNLMKKKAPKKGQEKETRGQGPKSRWSNSQKELGHKEAREPLNTQTSTSYFKHIN